MDVRITLFCELVVDNDILRDEVAVKAQRRKRNVACDLHDVEMSLFSMPAW